MNLHHLSQTFPRKLIWLLVCLTLAHGFNWPMMKLAVTEMAPMRFRTLFLESGESQILLTGKSGREYRLAVPLSRTVFLNAEQAPISRAEDSGPAVMIGNSVPWRHFLRFMSYECAPIMKQIDVGIIGTGWCGGIRAETCAAHPLARNLHLAEIRPERLAEVAKATGAQTATTHYRELLGRSEAVNLPLPRESST
jgi:hypothetical protein